MAASTPLLRKIVALLASEARERQIAAAIVLGELGARETAVVDALAAAATGALPHVQRHALDALARLGPGAGARRALPVVLRGLAARDEAVRQAAAAAAIAFGDAAVAPVRARLAEAADPAERRALEAVLGRVGGKDAFKALLAALDTPDLEAARTAALAVRARLKEATAREKAAYLSAITKALRTRQATARKPGAAIGLVSGCLKILGFLEDPAAVPTLLAFARDGKQTAAVREEAIVALRFVARGKTTAVAAALVDLAERAPLELGRAALYSLASLQLPAAIAPRLGKLAISGEPERALLAIERLAQIAGPAGAGALAGVLSSTKDRGRAEAAAAALGTRDDGAAALARALLAERHDERAGLLARLLRPRARALAAGAAGKKLAQQLVRAALARVGGGGATEAALVSLARELDREATADGLRAESATRRRRRDATGALALLRLVGQSADATAGDGYALAAAELDAGRRDEAFTIFGQLIDRGFDLAAAVGRDRHLDPAQRYQIGFALVERQQAAGEEILTALARGGRGKVAAMAKAKLASAGYA